MSSRVLSIAALVGIMVCLICDGATAGSFTWSLIPLASIVFAWAVTIPLVALGRKGGAVSLAILSIVIAPFLYALSMLTHTGEVFDIWDLLTALVMLACSVAFFLRASKKRRPA